ncbi:hypothetical protein B0H14DRAFT_777224 [Mycena olivaceomarginata]|nr:hypothetical protein B0H14DRAFT_777224 [Mycena olivaceomarginata]
MRCVTGCFLHFFTLSVHFRIPPGRKNQCSKTNERLGRVLTDAPSMHLPPPLEPHQKVCANRGEHTIFGFRVAHVASCTTISRKIPFLSASWFASSLSSAVREGLLQLGRVFKFPIAASSTQTMPYVLTHRRCSLISSVPRWRRIGPYTNCLFNSTGF